MIMYRSASTARGRDRTITAFDDPFALVAPDLRHSTPGQQRTWLIGEAKKRHLGYQTIINEVLLKASA
jgi:hypothetical protein